MVFFWGFLKGFCFAAIFMAVVPFSHADEREILARLDALEARINVLERSQAVIAPGFVCAAMCGGYEGRELAAERIQSSGVTLQAAFNNLQRRCPNTSNYIFIAADGRGLTLATPANACR